MKLKNLFYLLLALPLAFASCSDLLGDDTNTEEPAKEPKLTVTSSLEVEVDATSSTQIITYTLENAPADAKVSATCEAEWISITVASSIYFDVAANDGEAREATIVVSYEEQAFNVVVKQAAKPASTAPSFTLVSEPVIEVTCEQTAKSIEYKLENPIEGVEVEVVASADWIAISNVTDNAIDFIIAANEGSARTATITATYGILDPIVVTVNQEQYVNPDDVITAFEVVECWASSENGGKQWDVTFVEHDITLGDMQTRISFALAEANTQRVSDGTYSVANGGILLNTNTENGYSTYRHNSSVVADILDATFTVATDTATKTISIEGTFKVGDKNIEIKYNGEMRGMDLGEAVVGAIEYNEWASVNSTWCDSKECLFTAKSADGNLSIVIDIFHSGGSKIIPEGTYNLETKTASVTDIANNDTEVIYNNVSARTSTGTVIVEHIAGGYKITFDIMDNIDRNFKGSYEGPITGKAQNPA